MKRTVLLINGGGGAGKTTVGKLLVSEVQNAAFVDIDSLIIVNPWEYNNDLVKLGIQNSAVVAASFFESNYRLVCVSGNFLSTEHIRHFLESLPDEVLIIWVYLEVPKDIRKQRKMLRNRDEADLEKWFDYLDEKIGSYTELPKMDQVKSLVIDSSDLTPKEVVDRLIIELDDLG